MENSLKILYSHPISSDVTIILSGIKLNGTTRINNYIHKEYIMGVICTQETKQENEVDDKIRITAKILKGNEGENYFIAQEFLDFILKLFAMLGNDVCLNEFIVTPFPQLVEASVKVGFDTPQVTENDINIQAGKLLNKISDIDFSVLLNDLVESQRHISFNTNYEMVHRFRTLFAIFDNLAPKNSNGNVDYFDTALQDIFCENINGSYVEESERLSFALNTIIEAGLISYSKSRTFPCSSILKSAVENLSDTKLINREVAEKTLRCIQQVRNELNHGSFGLSNRNLVYWSYALLLPLVREYLKKKML